MRSFGSLAKATSSCVQSSPRRKRDETLHPLVCVRKRGPAANLTVDGSLTADDDEWSEQDDFDRPRRHPPANGTASVKFLFPEGCEHVVIPSLPHLVGQVGPGMGTLPRKELDNKTIQSLNATPPTHPLRAPLMRPHHPRELLQCCWGEPLRNTSAPRPTRAGLMMETQGTARV